jgi:hypothetical protein
MLTQHRHLPGAARCSARRVISMRTGPAAHAAAMIATGVPPADESDTTHRLIKRTLHQQRVDMFAMRQYGTRACMANAAQLGASWRSVTFVRQRVHWL